MQKLRNAVPGPGGPDRSWRAEESGQALIEYALIISLIALVSITALQTTGTDISSISTRLPARSKHETFTRPRRMRAREGLARLKVLVVGAGGVGGAAAAVAKTRRFIERMVLGDVDLARAEQVVAGLDDPRFAAARLDASDAAAIAELARAEGVDAILNACDPRFNPPIFQAAFDAGCTYLDMAMTLSERIPSGRTS